MSVKPCCTSIIKCMRTCLSSPHLLYTVKCIGRKIFIYKAYCSSYESESQKSSNKNDNNQNITRNKACRNSHLAVDDKVQPPELRQQQAWDVGPLPSITEKNEAQSRLNQLRIWQIYHLNDKSQCYRVPFAVPLKAEWSCLNSKDAHKCSRNDYIIRYIYHALINALSAHVIHINLNMIFYTHVEHSPTKTIDIKYYKTTTTTKTHYKHRHTLTVAETGYWY